MHRLLTHISTLGPSYSLPSNSSGAAYGGLPHQVFNSWPRENRLLKPKSDRTRGRKKKLIKMRYTVYLIQEAKKSTTRTCNFYVKVVVQKQVLRLQVSVDDVAAVAEVDSCHNLFELFPGILFCHSPMSHQMVYAEKVPFKTCLLRIQETRCHNKRRELF